MATSRKQQRGESVPKRPKREPTIVEVIFPDPVEEETPSSAANLSAPAVQSGSHREPVRLVFRF